MTRRDSRNGRIAAGIVVFLSLADGPVSAQEPQGFLRRVIGFTDAQITMLDAGQVVTKQLPAADKPEMVAFGAVWVPGDKQAVLQRLRDVEGLRRGPSVLQIGVFKNPPTVAEVASLTLEDGDFEAARQCRPGKCDLKLARSAMDRISREMHWSAPDARAQATDLFRRMLVEYTAAYIQGGTAAMATYEDKDKPLDAPTEFRRVLSASPYLIEYAPTFQHYLETYPASRLAGADDLFYWVKDKFGPKPTVAVYHVTHWQDPKAPTLALIASKQIYASHYFQAGFDLSALVDGPPGRGGFYLLDLYRARVDPPTGMLSGVLLGKIRGGIEQGVAEWLKAVKARAETPRTK